MRPDVRRWFARRTSTAAGWPVAGLAALDRPTVSVVLPALDEEATVGAIVAAIRRDLVEGAGLVDELVVVDSGSTDATARVAAEAGAAVVAAADVLPELGDRPGKGEALWKALHVTTGDIVVYVDADLVDFDTAFVTGLLGPLLTDPTVDFVKGTYARPLTCRGGVLPSGGGRVTELVARPLLNLHWPALAGFVQPLSGEYAARRTVLERVPFTGGYGVELGLLVDVLQLVGLDAMAQVDLGVRRHRNRDDAALGRMASAVWQAALARLDGAAQLPAPATSLTQFARVDGGYDVRVSDVTVAERPPMVTVPAYRRRRARAS